MSSLFFTRGESLVVSNHRFSSLIEFALTQAVKCVAQKVEDEFINSFIEISKSFYPGYDLDMEDTFKTTDERLFWSKVFLSVASAAEAGEIGNLDDRSWVSNFAADARMVSQLLLGSTHNAT